MSKQQRFEAIWSHVERDKAFSKAKSFTHIDLSKTKIRKEEKMEGSQSGRGNYWTKEAVHKLKSNIKRPVSELCALLKNKYTEDQIENKRRKILGIKVNGHEARQMVNKEVFFIICDTLFISPKEAFRKCEDVFKGASGTVAYYRNLIRTELQGKKSQMSSSYYAMLQEWYQNNYHEALPERNSGIVASKLADKFDGKRRYYASAQEDTNTPEVTQDKTEDLAEQMPGDEQKDWTQENTEPKAEDVQNDCSPVEPNTCVCECDCKCDDSSTVQYAVMIGTNLSAIHPNRLYCEGASSVYRQLGLTNISIVKLSITQIS